MPNNQQFIRVFIKCLYFYINGKKKFVEQYIQCDPTYVQKINICTSGQKKLPSVLLSEEESIATNRIQEFFTPLETLDNIIQTNEI